MKTRVDRMLERLKNHPIVAAVVVVAVVLIGLSQLADALRNLNPFSGSGVDNEQASVPDPGCVPRLVAEFKGSQMFAQDGGVSCAGAGPSKRGKSNSKVVSYSAPPGFRVVGAASVSEKSNIDGSSGQVEYHGENGVVTRVSVSISCKSEDKPFGSGASEQIALTGRIERVVSAEDVEQFRQQCVTTGIQ